MIAPLAISIEGLQVAAAGTLGVLLAVALVRVLLWVTEREALEHARRVADEFETIVRYGPRFKPGLIDDD